MFWNWGSFRKLELVQKDAERERVEIVNIVTFYRFIN